MEEIKLKNGILTFRKKLKKDETYKISKKKYTTLTIFNKPQIVKGVASYCADGKHVLFIDYDDVPRWLVEQDYKRLQDEYNLPEAYLLTTNEKEDNGEKIGNYHVICLAKFFPSKIYEILSKTHADVNYMSMPLRNKYRNWILRVSEKKNRSKPKFLCLIGDKLINHPNQISTSHLTLMSKLYTDIKHPSFVYQDFLDKIFLQEYEAL